MVGVALVVSAIFYAAQMFFFWKTNQAGVTEGLPADHVYFQFIAEQQRTMTWVFLSTALAVSGLLVLFGLVYSHRIAGPLYHLRNYLKARSQGRIQEPLAFRTNDYFQEVAESVNEYIYSQPNQTNAPTKKSA